tara:strand:- start:26396 stop:27202 length:807 start_codon:yes stop_codon:yes gene_type:complete
MEIQIITCKYGYYLSEVLRYILEKEDYKVKISDYVDLNSEKLHIILFSQKVKVFPKNYIIYQLEQKEQSKWIDKKYELSLLFSKRSWDYSECNINSFHELIQKKLTLFRLPCIKYELINNKINNKIQEFDVLFYGTMNNSRMKILNLIQMNIDPKYNIKIINNIFGQELFEYIKKCKIVLNISFYQDALLECYRINEVQSCEKLVISFFPNKKDIDNFNYYKESVIFVNSIELMVDRIKYYLENKEEYLRQISSIQYLKETKFIHQLL